MEPSLSTLMAENVSLDARQDLFLIEWDLDTPLLGIEKFLAL